MNVLVIGGTRLIGRHLVKYLSEDGHNVTIANRGITPDNFGDKVKRLVLERTSAESISEALEGKAFDVVYDSLAFSSNDVKVLLDAVKCKKYIMTSTVSVYHNYTVQMKESDFEPEKYPLKWLWRKDDSYNEVKRQAECALYQVYKDIPSIAARFPYVAGEDDYTKRLLFYVSNTAKSVPMSIDNIDERMSFIESGEAGKFLAALAYSGFCGKINASSQGTASIGEIIRYTEEKTGAKAVLTRTGENAPYNGTKTHSMDLKKAKDLGFEFSSLDSWLYELIDRLLDKL